VGVVRDPTDQPALREVPHDGPGGAVGQRDHGRVSVERVAQEPFGDVGAEPPGWRQPRQDGVGLEQDGRGQDRASGEGEGVVHGAARRLVVLVRVQ
jgi:hypothetical protein